MLTSLSTCSRHVCLVNFGVGWVVYIYIFHNYIYIYIYAYKCTYLLAHMYACVFHLCIYIYIMYIYVYIYIYYIHMYLHFYAYIFFLELFRHVKLTCLGMFGSSPFVTNIFNVDAIAVSQTNGQSLQRSLDTSRSSLESQRSQRGSPLWQGIWIKITST